MFKAIIAYFLLRLAQAHLKKGRVDKGVALLDRIVSFAPQYHFAYFHLGSHWLEKNDFEKAKNYFREAIKYAPKNSVYYAFLGIALYEQGDYTQARQSLQIALELDSENLLVHNHIAICCLAQGESHTFQKIINERGIFENTDTQIRLLLAMEAYMQRKSLPGEVST
jgi:tetratricopeptide (TPR) repeat protein